MQDDEVCIFAIRFDKEPDQEHQVNGTEPFVMTSCAEITRRPGRSATPASRRNG